MESTVLTATCVFLVALFFHFLGSSPSPGLDHLHTTLAYFLERGQLAIEVFPPISLHLAWLATSGQLYAYSIAVSVYASLLILLQLDNQTQRPPRQISLLLSTTAVYAVAVFPAWVLLRYLEATNYTALVAASDMGNTLISFSFYHEASSLVPSVHGRSVVNTLGLSDIAYALAGLLGCDVTDFSLCSFGILVRPLLHWARYSDNRVGRRHSCQGGLLKMSIIKGSTVLQLCKPPDCNCRIL